MLTPADLEAIRAVVRAELAAALAPRRPVLPAAKREALELLLPALAGRLGSREFTTAEVRADAALTRVIGTRSARTLGRLLAAAVEVPIGGLVVERVGADRNVALWRIVRVPNVGFSTDETYGAPPA